MMHEGLLSLKLITKTDLLGKFRLKIILYCSGIIETVQILQLQRRLENS